MLLTFIPFDIRFPSMNIISFDQSIYDQVSNSQKVFSIHDQLDKKSFVKNELLENHFFKAKYLDWHAHGNLPICTILSMSQSEEDDLMNEQNENIIDLNEQNLKSYCFPI